MNFCDLTLESPAENLACDEVLLDRCEAGVADEVLRVWESPTYFVVLGYANRATAEANLPFCRQNTIPIYRRCTGGGAVLQGPGSLNYSLILPTDPRGPCHSIAATNDFVMHRHLTALSNLLKAPVEIRGCTDLAIGGLKFCGNAQRRKKGFLIFHGSFLLHADIDLMEHALPLPARQPEYRLGRSHSDFLLNLKLKPALLKSALQKAWNASGPLPLIPFDQIGRLAQEKYSRPDWNLRF